MPMEGVVPTCVSIFLHDWSRSFFILRSLYATYTIGLTLCPIIVDGYCLPMRFYPMGSLSSVAMGIMYSDNVMNLHNYQKKSIEQIEAIIRI